MKSEITKEKEEKKKKMKTPDEKRVEKFRKLCVRVSNIKEKEINELPEWRRRKVIEMIRDMERCARWIQRYFEKEDDVIEINAEEVKK